MNKKVLLLVLIFVFVVSGTALADTRLLTRGDFANMLAEKIGGEGTSVDLLIKKGVIKGYPDGSFGLEQEISQIEAIALCSRAIGIKEYIAPPTSFLPKDHWAHSPCGWFNYLGLIDEKPKKALSIEEGSALLDKVFGVDSDAIDLIEQAQSKEREFKNIQSLIEGSFSIIPRAGVDGSEFLIQPEIEISIAQEIIFPDKIHQLSTVRTKLPSGTQEEILTESYFVDGVMYQGFPDIQTKEMNWFRYPGDFSEFFKQEQQVKIMPEDIGDLMHYYLLGTTKINDKEVFSVSFYGYIDDYILFLKEDMGQFGDIGELGQSFATMLDVIDSISYWGIQHIEIDGLLVCGGNFNTVITYKEKFMDEPMPIESIAILMEIKDYVYDEDIFIEVPAEALTAPVQEFLDF